MRLVLACVLGLAVAFPAAATTMLTLDLPALVGRADRVVLGQVVSQESHFSSDHRTIYTDVVVTVTRSYKGSAKVGDRLTLRREGGSVGGIAALVSGSARFTVGEEAVLFVTARSGHDFVVGMAQGKMNVSVRPSDGKKVVAADLSGLDLVPGRTPIGMRTLDELERDIHAQLQRGR